MNGSIEGYDMVRQDGQIEIYGEMEMEMGYEMIHKDGSNGQDSVYVDQNIMAVMDGVGGWID